MFGTLFNRFTTPATPTFTITNRNGRFAIVDNEGNEVKSYARRADAFRGATRLGLTIA